MNLLTGVRSRAAVGLGLLVISGVVIAGSALAATKPTTQPTKKPIVKVSVKPILPKASAIPSPTPVKVISPVLTSTNLKMLKPYTPTPKLGGNDDYRCFILDPKLTENAFITAVTFTPGIKDLVHHAILFRVTSEMAAEALTKDPDGTGWTCFGGVNLGKSVESMLDTPWLSAWVPGKGADLMPKDVGVPFEQGSKIVVQIHYNLLAGSNITLGKKRDPDQSSIVLQSVPMKDSKLSPLSIALLPAPVELACPAEVTGLLCDRKASLADLVARTTKGSSLIPAVLGFICGQDSFAPKPSNTSTCDKRISANQTIVFAAPHMHLLGKSLKMELNPGTAMASVILDQPKYDFDNQTSTVLTNRIEIKAGDVVRITCVFDPSERQKNISLKDLAPRYVTWGEGSSDEMCLGILGTIASK